MNYRVELIGWILESTGLQDSTGLGHRTNRVGLWRTRFLR